MRKTKIICTIGPACDTVDQLKKMIRAGMNVARLNFSHGTHDGHAATIAAVRQAAAEENQHIAIMLDTKGPEIRTGKLEQAPVMLSFGEQITLTTEVIKGTAERISVSYANLPQEVRPKDHILLSDGQIVLEVVSCTDKDIVCRIINGGSLGENKGVNIPGVRTNMPFLSAHDESDIQFGIEQKVDYIAASFVRSPEDVLALKRRLEEEHADLGIIAKIESQSALHCLDEIIPLTDGVMVARGDLGVEIPFEEVPLVQKDIVQRCSLAGKIVIIATQMLETMIQNPKPTRAEVSDVANAIFDGADAIMLSGESAAGKYPLEAVTTMAKIAERAETSYSYTALLDARRQQEGLTVTDAISYATCATAHKLGINTILSATNSGNTAKHVAKYRPLADIIAATPHDSICRKLALVWGVQPILTHFYGGTDEVLEQSVQVALADGWLHYGDPVVMTGGDPEGGTNLLKVQVISEILVRGMGVGKMQVSGEVKCLRHGKEDDEITADQIIVCYGAGGLGEGLKNARGIIAEEGGLTSESAILGMHYQIPVIVGAKNATEVLKDGMIITIDPLQGRVYSGKVPVL